MVLILCLIQTDLLPVFQVRVLFICALWVLGSRMASLQTRRRGKLSHRFSDVHSEELGWPEPALPFLQPSQGLLPPHLNVLWGGVTAVPSFLCP